MDDSPFFKKFRPAIGTIVTVCLPADRVAA
jgi:hypothetical protein